MPVVGRSPDDVAEFIRATRHHRVAPLAQVRLRDSRDDLAQLLRHDRDVAVAMHAGAGSVLRALAELLGDIPWLTFKGPVLSDHAHPVCGLRVYHDLDVLVDPRSLREVVRRLVGAGWRLTDSADMLRGPDVAGELHWLSPMGVLVDMHWSMINMRKNRRRFAIDSAELLAARRRVIIAGAEAWTLSWPDTVVHVCLHAALSGASRMLFLLDIDQVARRDECDWAEVVATAQRWRAAAPVHLGLSRARRVLATPIPRAVELTLGTTGGRWIAAAADRLAPVPHVRHDASFARLVARGVRPGALPTLATVGAHALQGLIDRARRRGQVETPVAAAPADEAALEAYLIAVERESGSSARAGQPSGLRRAG